MCNDFYCTANRLGRCTNTVCTKYGGTYTVTVSDHTEMKKDYFQCPHCGQTIEKK
jgi:PHP family Zn ribbon phosphoesterase